MASMTPWWDRTVASDGLVVLGFGVVWLFYRKQKRDSKRQMQKAALDHLRGVKAALDAWYDDFFSASYAGSVAGERAHGDYLKIMKFGVYVQNYRVPIEPVSSLIQPTGGTWSFSPETVRAANVALFRMTFFNQLVQQQTDFNRQHAADLRRFNERRTPIAQAAERISEHIHAVIDNAKWYKELDDALATNIQQLERMLNQPVRPRRWLLAGLSRLIRALQGDEAMTPHT